ncbi:MAG: acyl-CoA dehydratase activase-related protein [Synergistaceae bacterium]|nr:acyl-CoA dehydratase activase-related protein [Synergistaceae bacterium]
MSLLHIGLDIGSITVKSVVLDDDDRIIYSKYCRHFADIRSITGVLMSEIHQSFRDASTTIAVTGSGALALAEGMQVTFAQELIACSTSVGRYLRGVDVSIELGGEDAKLTFFDPSGADQRMNETCAGGTGAFIDQMAALLGTDPAGLNELAKRYETLYPIASRCGVFARTDVQPLLNEGVSRADIAASIFQAIVNQTISGLACGRKISGNVAFLGGPLYFLSELRARFMETLELPENQCMFPENSHLFVAIGAAILGKKSETMGPGSIQERVSEFLSMYGTRGTAPSNVLGALFIDGESRRKFKERHSARRVRRTDLASYSGGAYLGLDAGSTTTKAVLIGEEGELLFSRYCQTGGREPVRTVKEILTSLYAELPNRVRIRKSGVTGYGERLIQAAFGLDVGEVETVAHARAAEFILPGVEFVIDIGGQDMKCFGVRDGVITRVFLNEACSSGCGSFLQNFAGAQGMSVEDFALLAEDSLMPVDLGSRCTVFMTSRVRQAQKEGADIRDISAGLVYSVVRNALYKVLKLRSADELGERVVVQGGAFRNDALLRAFELVSGREVVRPQIAELMGAFGMALLARDAQGFGESRLIGASAVDALTGRASTSRCARCGNRCLLTRTEFGDGRSCVSGSRCERGVDDSGDKGRKKNTPPDVCERKYKRLFDPYRPLPESDAPRGLIGVPRALNMYEDYPFWFTFLTGLGFRVELSRARPDENSGMDTIPSQALCYPAKLVHRHVADLLARETGRIFYPILMRETREFEDAHQSFNCPVVVGYPDVAALNIGAPGKGADFIRPTLPFDFERLEKPMVRRLHEEFSRFDASAREIRSAFEEAGEAQRLYRADVRRYGDEAVAYLRENGGVGVVLAGHPYHLDPEVHHGIPELIVSCGAAVLTEDSIAHRAEEIGGMDPLYVVDQWAYHSRLYRAATVVARHPDFANVQMVQLNSFGCGLDAVSADQVAALLERGGKRHTLIRIDEGKNNGAARIRIRSLLASVTGNGDMDGKKNDERQKAMPPVSIQGKSGGRFSRVFSVFSKNLTKPRTILCPPLSMHHFRFLRTVMREEGLDFRVLPEGGRAEVELGLKYVSNDVCYPAMMIVGQFLKALTSGEYDPDATDCLYAQTGGVCRASNYVPLLRRALDAAGFERVRVLAVNALNANGAEKFSIPPRALWRGLMGMLYGDMLMRLLYRTRPCEIVRGSAEKLYNRWSARCDENVARGKWAVFRDDLRRMALDFAALPIDPAPRPRVGIVGEILVKYHSGANERLVNLIEAEGGEAVVSDLANFVLYCLFSSVRCDEKPSIYVFSNFLRQFGTGLLEHMRKPMREALKGTRFGEIRDIRDMAAQAGTLVSLANQAGEGWLLVAEIMQLIEGGVKNILCVQPFACLPNHITGRGVIKELKRIYQGVNILALDYDASVSAVNQLNRIKLLMATGRGG